MPRNAITGRAYSGVNVPLLWMARDESAYPTSRWLTFKQALDAGGNVRKGEKGNLVIYVGAIEKDTDAGEKERIAFLKSFTVFNLAQCDGLEALDDTTPPAINPGERNQLAESFLKSSGANITHGEARAYFSNKQDRINLPLFESFTGSAEYYSTAFHELTHWTGHESRLNRTFGKRFGDNAYSAEELVAELGSAFLCAEFGFDNETLDNSAAYIDHWRGVLQANERLFTAAAAAASKAHEYLRDLANAAPAEEWLIAAE
jgi:antirestriction protein ArdC